MAAGAFALAMALPRRPAVRQHCAGAGDVGGNSMNLPRRS
jgi:hypothetical protein